MLQNKSLAMALFDVYIKGLDPLLGILLGINHTIFFSVMWAINGYVTSYVETFEGYIIKVILPSERLGPLGCVILHTFYVICNLCYIA